MKIFNCGRSKDAYFVVYKLDPVNINFDASNPSFFNDLLLSSARGFELWDSATGSVKNKTGRKIAWCEGTINFQPNKDSGGISLLKLVSERSNDEGLTWIPNELSLRSIEISNSGETFRTVISAVIDWKPNEIIRFRCYNASGAEITFEQPADIINGEIYAGPSLLWSLREY